MSDAPLVSIGLPTYNRAAMLDKAMQFVLAQDYRNIEVVISDNGSTDQTAEVCRKLSERDSRIRIIRQPENIGPTANYRVVLEGATGEYYLALADDDWLAPNYVSECLAYLRSHPDHALVCGKAEMYRDGKFSHPAVKTMLTDDSPTARIVEYYLTVSENAAYHGVVRRDLLMSLPPMPNTMGGDWSWIASIAFQGKISTLETTGVVKHLGGSTASWETTVERLGLPAWQAPYWTEAILSLAVSDIAWKSPVYAPLGVAGRAALAARVTLALCYKWRIWRRWRSYVKDYLQGRRAD